MGRPRVRLRERPSALSPLMSGGLLGADSVWLKRDDLLAPEFGGSKVRNLEYQLGEALHSGADALLVSARAGSNAVAAASIFAPANGLALHALVKPQADSATARTNLATAITRGAHLIPVGEPLLVRSTGRAMQAQRRKLEARGHRVHLLPFGGGGLLGAIAHIGAAFELGEQIAQTGLDPVGTLYIAAASFTAAAGLLAGIELAGLNLHLAMVSVVDPIHVDDAAICMLAREAASRWLGDDRTPLELPADKRSYRFAVGPGFGLADVAAEMSCAPHLSETMSLDSVYTAKAFAAMVAELRQEPRRPGIRIFWHSGNSRRPGADAAKLGTRLPHRFERLFT